MVKELAPLAALDQVGWAEERGTFGGSGTGPEGESYEQGHFSAFYGEYMISSVVETARKMKKGN
jgi:hypothetical protein